MWVALIGGTACAVVLLKIFHERLCKILGGKYATGSQRRKNFPPAHPSNHPAFPHKLLQERSFSGLDITWHQIDGMPSRPSGTRLFYQKISPQNVKSKVVLHLVHGLDSHSDGLSRGQAALLANALEATIFVLDQYGNGRSDGLHGFIPSYQAVVEDQIYFVEKIVRPAAATTNVSVFAYGMSMGGGITTHVCIQRPDLYDGAILEGPLLALAADALPPWLILQFLKMICSVIPAAPLIPLTDNAVEKVFKDPEVRVAAERINTYFWPNLCYNGNMRLGTGNQCIQLCSDLQANDWQLVKDKFVTPVLVLHGDRDEICPIEGSRSLVAHAAAEDKALHVVSDGFHCLTAAEPENVLKNLLERVTEWIRDRQR